MKLILIRHCETQKNIDDKFDFGNTADRLTLRGEQQLKYLVRFIRKRYSPKSEEILIASPRDRALLTAKPLVKSFGLKLQIYPNLTPINPGSLSGLTYDESLNTFPQLMQLRMEFRNGQVDGYNVKFPNGDSLLGFEKKIALAFHKIKNTITDERVFMIMHRSTSLAALNIFSKLFHSQSAETYVYYETPDGYIDEVFWMGDIESSYINRLGRVFND